MQDTSIKAVMVVLPVPAALEVSAGLDASDQHHLLSMSLPKKQVF
jgi:hypothetical protein